ncbi:hypothetical protein IAR55_005386 [Kwoniella newhampshirensis]|uniref:Uncharacterized protein n=1 Tax=Kwoniella newhampshirensis TaxID=1651941 RepID=A0AAW0YTN9_9TREE
MSSPSTIVIIFNGFPGVGKLTVAKETSKLLPGSKVFDNHLLIDAAAALFERDDLAYHPFRKALRSATFDSLISYPESRPRTIIFTECQSDDPDGTLVMTEYLTFVKAVDAKLISVILTCSERANEKRLISDERKEKGRRTKLTDVEVLRTMRDKVIYRFDASENALVRQFMIDTTDSEGVDVAQDIRTAVYGMT